MNTLCVHVKISFTRAATQRLTGWWHYGSSGHVLEIFIVTLSPGRWWNRVGIAQPAYARAVSSPTFRPSSWACAVGHGLGGQVREEFLETCLWLDRILRNGVSVITTCLLYCDMGVQINTSGQKAQKILTWRATTSWCLNYGCTCILKDYSEYSCILKKESNITGDKFACAALCAGAKKEGEKER